MKMRGEGDFGEVRKLGHCAGILIDRGWAVAYSDSLRRGGTLLDRSRLVRLVGGARSIDKPECSLWLRCFIAGVLSSLRVWVLNNDIISVLSATDPVARDVLYSCMDIAPFVAIAFAAHQRSSLLSNRALSGMSIVAAIAGAAMFLMAGERGVAGLAQASYALCVLGGMWAGASFALTLCHLRSPRDVALCLCSAYAFASPLEWSVSLIPFEARIVVWVVATCAVVALTCPLAGDMVRQTSEKGSRDVELSQPRSFVSPFNMAFWGLFAFRFVAGFSLALNSVSGVPVHTFLSGIVPLVVGAWIGVGRRERGREDILFQIASLLVIAGMLSAMVSVLHALGTTSNMLLASADECFKILQMLVVVAMASRNKINAVFVVASAQVFTSTGMMLGAGAGHMANGIVVSNGAAALAFLAVLLFLFVAFCFIWIDRVGFERIIYGIQPVRPLVVVEEGSSAEGRLGLEERCAQLALQKGLTKRETEILTMLARGRNGKFIEEHYVVSYNTVKTHVKHIYLKLDVHSQQELIDLVENFGCAEEKGGMDG